MFCIGRSIDNSAGDYFLDLFAPQTEQRLRAHNAYWDERGRAHAEYWKAFFPNAVDILLRVASETKLKFIVESFLRFLLEIYF